MTFSRFEEIVLVDFEFNGGEGNRPNVVCLVAYELRSGRRFRLWRDQLGSKPPYRSTIALYSSPTMLRQN